MAWVCPLDGRSSCRGPFAIGLDGGLRHVIVDAILLEKGWKMVNFPKQTWYAEYDQTSPFYKNKNIKDFEELPVGII